MSVFRRKPFLNACIFAGALAALLFLPARPPEAADTVRIYASTFDKFVNSIPLQATGRYKFQVTINLGLLGRHKITVCDSNYTAIVSGMKFAIAPSNVRADGDLSATWCGLSFGGKVSSTGNIYYASGDKTVRFDFWSAAVQPSFTVNVFGFTFTVRLPMHVNVAPTLEIPPLPVRSTRISFETADGPRNLYMTPHDVTLVKRDGYIELDSNVSFW